MCVVSLYNSVLSLVKTPQIVITVVVTLLDFFSNTLIVIS
jgi:hypothetical protein